MPLLVLSTTGSVAQMGIVVGLSTAGQLAGGLLAGPIVDRLDRRRLMLACDWLQLALVGLIPVVWWLVPASTLETAGIWLIYTVVTVSSVLVSVSLVGLRAIVPQVAGREALVRANGRLTVATEVAYGCGPAIAGLTVAALGEPTAIGINALTFGTSALTWQLIRLRPAEPAAAAGEPLRGRLAGLRFIWRDRMLRSLGVLEIGNGLLVAGTTTLFIYYVRHDLGESSAIVGVLLSLASVGAVLAAVGATKMRDRLGFGRAWLAGIGVQGAALLGVGLTRSVWGVAALAVVFAFGQITAAILAVTFRQERTPDHLLGRVSAAALTIGLAARAVGGVASATAAGRISTPTVLVALGVGTVALVLIGFRTPLRARASEVEA
jgi:Na+/melibiose symporter-like transporter